MVVDKTNLISLNDQTLQKSFNWKHCTVMFAITFSLSALLTFGISLLYFHLTFAEISQNDIFSDLPPSPAVINRSQWGGRPPLERQHDLKHPVNLVILAHTVTPFCTSFTECSKIVKSIQNYHRSRGMNDIAYNFLIGGDENIYVGRGWDVENIQRNQSISVSFIGNFLYDFLTEGMVEALQELLNEGVENGKLIPNYEIVCHNQTVPTLSPGINVYEVVKNWEHFRVGKV